MKKIIIKKYYKKNIIITKKFFSDTLKKNFFLSKHIIMVNLTTHELRLMAGKRGINNYKKICQEKSY